MTIYRQGGNLWILTTDSGVDVCIAWYANRQWGTGSFGRKSKHTTVIYYQDIPLPHIEQIVRRFHLAPLNAVLA